MSIGAAEPDAHDRDPTAGGGLEGTRPTQKSEPPCDDAGTCCPAGTNAVLGTNAPNVWASSAPSRCYVGLGGGDTVADSSASGLHAALGGAGNDVLQGGYGPAILAGGADNDTLTGRGANDELYGQGGSDTLASGAGNDVLGGGDGNDTIDAGAGDDDVQGNAGDDVLNGGAGNDVLVGGPGRDTAYGGTGDDTVVVHDVCELAAGEVLAGDGGSDTLKIPVPLAQVQALGVVVSGFESVVVGRTRCQSECFSAPSCEAQDVDVVFDGLGSPTTVLVAAPVEPLADLPPDDYATVVSPLLAQRVATATSSQQLAGVLVRTRSTVRIPALPRFVAAEPRESPTNVAILAERRRLLDEAFARRRAEQDSLVAMIEAGGGTVQWRSGLGPFLGATLPASVVGDLAASGVPRWMGGRDPSAPIVAPRPPEPGPLWQSMHAARELTGVNDLIAAGLTGAGYNIGLMDTGVNSHDLLEGRIANAWDCTTWDENFNCTGSDPSECSSLDAPLWHGTSVAGICSGSEVYGMEDAGVSDARLHSFRTAERNSGTFDCGTWRADPSLAAATMAAALDDAFIANIQFIVEDAPELVDVGDAVASALGDLFDAGLPIVVAAGNTMQLDDPSVTRPGRGEKVLAIGGANPDLQLAYGGHGGGDGGIQKPELVAPTDLLTATGACPTCSAVLAGTSAATPFAGGMLSLLLHAYDAFGGTDTPPELTAGRVYASLLAFGRSLDPQEPTPNELEGVGLPRFRDVACTRWRWGSADVPADGSSFTVDLPFPQGAEDVSIAAWWTNDGAGIQNVALRLKRASTTHLADLAPSVFQVLRIDVLAGGTWEFTLRGLDSTEGSRRVHYFVHHRLPQIACTVGVAP